MGISAPSLSLSRRERARERQSHTSPRRDELAQDIEEELRTCKPDGHRPFNPIVLGIREAKVISRPPPHRTARAARPLPPLVPLVPLLVLLLLRGAPPKS